MDFIVNSFQLILRSSVMATFVALVILIIRFIFKSKIGVKGNYLIWLILILRLLMPYTPKSQISFFNLFNHNYSINQAVNGSEVKSNNKTVQPNVPTSSLNANNKLKNNISDTGTNKYIKTAAFIWISVAAVLVLRTIFVVILFSYKLNSYREIRDVNILDMMRDCKNKLKTKKNIRIYKTSLVKVPSIFGIFKPKLLLPMNLDKQIKPDELKHIIFHEIGHVKRKDIEVSCIVTIIQIIHWFNPVLWYSFYKMSIDREIACDALAISALGENQNSNYGMTILKFVRKSKMARGIYSMESFASSKNEIKGRIKMISKFKKRSYKLTAVAVVILVIVGAIMLTNSKNIGLTGKNSSSKISEDKTPTKIENSKDDSKANTSVKGGGTSGKTDKLNSSSTGENSKNNNAASNTQQKQQTSSAGTNQDISGKVKDYIINGQNNLSSAERLNWSKRFLNQVDIDSLYKKYTANGGNAGNVQDFAKYITSNAPTQSNWQDLFKKDYYDLYGQNIKVTKYVYLGNGLYQAYINQNGSEVPCVTVSSKTGYFHG